jgi:colanic acid/amylovoran biosynthesis glycosyltransferase
MPVAYLVSRYPAYWQPFVCNEVLALRELGVDVRTVTVRAPAEEEALSATEHAERASTHVLVPARIADLLVGHLAAIAARPRRYLATLAFAWARGGPGVRGRLWQMFYVGEAVLLWRWCRAHGIRHVHVHFANAAADVALLLVHFADEPRGERWSWSFTMHGPAELFDVRGQRLADKARRAAWVQCISEYARSQLMALLEPSEWSKLHVIHSGIDPSVYSPARRSPPEAGPVRLLTVGRLVAGKAHALLLQAVAVLRERGVEAGLTVVGEGPERARLEALARSLGVDDRVAFTGAIGQDDMPERYAAADVFCLSSVAEGLPVVLLEAMASGLPVVAPRITGVPEAVQDGVSGRLVAPGSRAELVEALSELAGDPEARADLGAAGRARVVAEFDARASARRIEGILRNRLPAAALK